MNLEFFIARRTAGAESGAKSGVLSRIAVVAVALSMVVMLLALAVITGFKREVTRRMTGFAAHATVTDVRGVRASETEPVRRSVRLDSLLRAAQGVVSVSPYAVKGGVVKTPDAVEEVLLKGVDGSYDFAFFAGCLTEGNLPRTGDSLRVKEVLLSRLMADRLQLGPGDKVDLFFIGGDAAPRRDRFRISGLYASGMDEMDRVVALTDIRNVQRLCDWNDGEVSGYEIGFADPERLEEDAAWLDQTLLYDEALEQDLVVNTLYDRYPAIFDWLRAHDVNAAVIIGIMLAVAFFNMATALLILVLERTRMIGLLKALGMRDASVRRIFLYRALFTTLRGLGWGNLVGVGLCLVQRWCHVVKFSSEGYLLSEAPIALEWSWWLPLNAGVAFTIFVLLLLPSRIIATVKPDESIRYE